MALALQDQQEILARLALLQLAPPEQQELELPVLREAMAALVQQVPLASPGRLELEVQWARLVVPVLKALRAARVPSAQRVILEAQERRALLEAEERLVLRDQAAHKGSKE